MKIEIDTKPVQARTVTSNRTGKEMTFYEQTAYAHLPGTKYPVEFKLNVPGQNSGFKPGEYNLDLEKVVKVGNYGGLELDTRDVPLIPAQQRTAAAS